MGKQPAKHGKVQQQEAELKKLQQQKAKYQKQVSNQKNKVAELHKKMSTVQQDIVQEATSSQKAYKIKSEVRELLRKIKSTRKIKKTRRESELIRTAIEFFTPDDEEEEMQEQFGDFFNSSEEDMENFAREYAEKNTDEFNRKRFQDFFHQFKPEIPEADRKQLRKIFVQLANRFHPDKAKTPEEQDLFHKIMQELNTVYEQGDIDRILQIQEQYKEYETGKEVDPLENSGAFDFLQAQIGKLQAEVELLIAQVDRLKAEATELRKSELMQVQREQQKYFKMSGTNARESHERQQDFIERMTSLREGLKEYIESGRMSGNVEQFLIEIEAESKRSVMDYFFEMMSDMMDEDEGRGPFFSWNDEDDDEEEDNPPPSRRKKKKK